MKCYLKWRNLIFEYFIRPEREIVWNAIIQTKQNNLDKYETGYLRNLSVNDDYVETIKWRAQYTFWDHNNT